MRTIISAALLLASTAAMPALAQDNPQGDPHAHDGGGRHDGDQRGGGQHGDGQRGGDQRGNGGAQPQPRPGPQGGNVNRGPQGGQPQAQPQARPGPNGGDYNRGAQGGRPDGGNDQGRHIAGRPEGGAQVWRDQNGRGQGGRGQDGRDQDGRGPGNQGDRPAWANHPGAHGGEGGYRPNGGGQGGYDRGQPGAGYDRGRPGGGYDRGRQNGGGDWNRGWRQDQRYNWQGYRDSHRDAYRIGRYNPPRGYGWGYRRYGIGAALEAGFFSQDYWIGNPGYYRLPPAYGPYRWVRYYNDALLVNVYNGQIADEIPDFFY